MTQWNHEGFLGPGREGRPRRQRFGCRDAVEPVPVEHCGHRELISERDFQLIAALKGEIAPWRWTGKRPYRGIRFSWAQRDDAGFGLQLQGWAPLSGSDPSYGRAEGQSAQPRHKLASA
jgi:hypothetical protein